MCELLPAERKKNIACQKREWRKNLVLPFGWATSDLGGLSSDLMTGPWGMEVGKAVNG